MERSVFLMENIIEWSWLSFMRSVGISRWVLHIHAPTFLIRFGQQLSELL